ncbi:MAG: hypothetical protein DMF86_13535 [Acidobacteria bacterium]|nr:MAG: hypothetical protein DMF86_13535 [Acidobacteriota bacterium]
MQIALGLVPGLTQVAERPHDRAVERVLGDERAAAGLIEQQRAAGVLQRSVRRGTFFSGSQKPPSREAVAVKIWTRSWRPGASATAKLPSVGSRSNALGSRSRPASAPISASLRGASACGSTV